MKVIERKRLPETIDLFGGDTFTVVHKMVNASGEVTSESLLLEYEVPEDAEPQVFTHVSVVQLDGDLNMKGLAVVMEKE